LKIQKLSAAVMSATLRATMTGFLALLSRYVLMQVGSSWSGRLSQSRPRLHRPMQYPADLAALRS